MRGKRKKNILKTATSSVVPRFQEIVYALYTQAHKISSSHTKMFVSEEEGEYAMLALVWI